MSAHILLVGTNAEAAEVIVRFLRREGYDVSAVFDREEALEAIKKTPTDLVLVDMSYSTQNYALLCTDIKADDKTALIPIIVFLGIDDSDLRSQAIMAGADDVLMKPFEQGKLRDRIRPLLRAKQVSDRLLRIRKLESKRVFVEEEPPSPSPNTVETVFTFRDEVKVPCEQYVLYFVEFLHDIGIEATAELREVAGRVLFSVTPKDKDEALDNIREALNLYLGLVGSRTALVPVSSQDGIESHKLSGQLHHLHAQIYLVGTALHHQDSILHQQQVLIQQQADFTKIALQALQQPSEEDTEPLIGNLVKVKRWGIDAIPFELNLPEIFRRLKAIRQK